ncbi:MAG: RNA polymerase sigma factor [Flavipsychrobacter sp.]
MQQQSDDMLLIQAILQGQHNSYAQLVDKYQAYVFTLVLRYVPDRPLAEELAQDVFMKAFRCLADFKGNSKFSTWLYTIVNTTCLSHLRKKKDETVLLAHEQISAHLDQFQSTDNADDRLKQKARESFIATAMRYLPPEDAKIITLFYQLEQSVDEIGKVLGITTANVKVKLFRARQKLREIIETKFRNELV